MPPTVITTTVSRPISFIGITLIAFGTGGIKPCVVTFGANQFKVSIQGVL